MAELQVGKDGIRQTNPEDLAAAEAQAAIDTGARILPVRQEQLKERLGECFRE